MKGLVDANNFYVSCERVFDLSLVGKPVAVLSNNDGCVISCSQEFKDLGIPRGTPYFRLADRKDLRFRSSNYTLYGDISRRIVEILGVFAPVVDPYSIDESFIEVDLGRRDYLAYGKKIRETILQWVGIPCGVGFAPTRTLAKIANHIGKKRPEGVFVMPADPRGVLEDLPVGEVWGVGHRLSEKLVRKGIRTAWALAQADPGFLRDKYSVLVARTALELRGVSCLSAEDFVVPLQSVSCSRSFGEPATTLAELEESVASHLAEAAEKLRKNGMRASGATVYAQEFQPGEHSRAAAVASVQAVFPETTDDTSAMLDAVMGRVKGMFSEGTRYRKTGAMLYGLESRSVQRMDLFSCAAPRDSRLYRAVDELNGRFGRGTVFTAAEGIGKSWRMKREMLSGRPTTCWDEILKVR